MKREDLSAEDGAVLLRKLLMKEVTILGALFAVGIDSIILSLTLSVSLCCQEDIDDVQRVREGVFHMTAFQMCFSTRSWDTTLLFSNSEVGNCWLVQKHFRRALLSNICFGNTALGPCSVNAV